MESKNFNLDKRTKAFAKQIIQFCKKVKKDEISRPLITQLVKAATSIGANFAEAENSMSKADFIHKITIVRKEAKESEFFIEMLITFTEDNVILINDLSNLLQESMELRLIFNSIYHKLSKK